MKKYLLFLGVTFLAASPSGFSQDSHFSQFFMAPQFIDPALAGNFEGNWRIMGNFRQQWGLAATPFTTAVFAGEMKMSGKEEGENTLAAGGAMMFDQSLDGAFKSNYAVANVAYHARLDDLNSIGVGFHGMYANRRIDYSSLSFGEQFTSINGFDLSSPSGETTLTSAQPYFSLGAGAIYNFKTDIFSLGIGAAAFHLNKPRQSFLGDPNQIVPMRYVGHLNSEFQLSASTTLAVNAIYQRQKVQNYFAVGGALGRDISGGYNSSFLYVGGWFREGDSFYPYMAVAIGQVQLGFSYDLTYSKQIQGPAHPRSFEMSFVLRQKIENPDLRQTQCAYSPWH